MTLPNSRSARLTETKIKRACIHTLSVGLSTFSSLAPIMLPSEVARTTGLDLCDRVLTDCRISRSVMMILSQGPIKLLLGSRSVCDSRSGEQTEGSFGALS